MKISFDLDDTLIPSGKATFTTEKQSIIHRILGIETLRKETVVLWKSLQESGHKVGIYTTSYRSKSKIKLFLYSYGISPDFIINEHQNRKELNHLQLSCSKYPPAFEIDLHIDDAKGVEIEANRYSFNALILGIEDHQWTTIVEETITSLVKEP